MSVTLLVGDAYYSGQDASEVMLLWTDPPYGTNQLRHGQAGTYRDPADIEPTISAIESWLPHLHPEATVVVCCDYRLAPQLATQLSWQYRGEIIWQFGLGRPRETWWPVRHNNLLIFTRTSQSGQFNTSAVPRVPRRAPKRGYPDDKPGGSVWDYTFSNTHPERVGYPNQKPIQIIEPFILAHTGPDDLVLDIYCGSGSTGMAAIQHNRRFLGIDNNPQAIELARQRLTQPALFESAIDAALN